MFSNSFGVKVNSFFRKNDLSSFLPLREGLLMQLIVGLMLGYLYHYKFNLWNYEWYKCLKWLIIAIYRVVIIITFLSFLALRNVWLIIREELFEVKNFKLFSKMQLVTQNIIFDDFWQRIFISSSFLTFIVKKILIVISL